MTEVLLREYNKLVSKLTLPKVLDVSIKKERSLLETITPR